MSCVDSEEGGAPGLGATAARGRVYQCGREILPRELRRIFHVRQLVFSLVLDDNAGGVFSCTRPRSRLRPSWRPASWMRTKILPPRRTTWFSISSRALITSDHPGPNKEERGLISDELIGSTSGRRSHRSVSRPLCCGR